MADATDNTDAEPREENHEPQGPVIADEVARAQSSRSLPTRLRSRVTASPSSTWIAPISPTSPRSCATSNSSRCASTSQASTTCSRVRAGSHRASRPSASKLSRTILSHTRNRRVRVICQVPENDPTVPSVTASYPGANFPERETYDMFGITFDGHPELTRILMPDDWRGFPLRKDDAPARVPVTFKGDPQPR